jgi:hypothetical protein
MSTIFFEDSFPANLVHQRNRITEQPQWRVVLCTRCQSRTRRARPRTFFLKSQAQGSVAVDVQSRSSARVVSWATVRRLPPPSVKAILVMSLFGFVNFTSSRPVRRSQPTTGVELPESVRVPSSHRLPQAAVCSCLVTRRYLAKHVRSMYRTTNLGSLSAPEQGFLSNQ